MWLRSFLRRLRGEAPSPWIEVDELARRLSRMTVIDVRGPDEFTGPLGHIARAINLPVGDLGGRLAEIDALKVQPIALVCRTDKRSSNAAFTLRDAGFRDVHVLRGGMERWNREGLPVEGRGA